MCPTNSIDGAGAASATVHVLRHGNVEREGLYGRSDISLSTEGWSTMAQAVWHLPWQQVVSSPLRRCARFAQKLSNAHGAEFVVMRDFIEYDFGEWEGKTLESIHQQAPHALGDFWRDPWGHEPPGAERMDNFCRRVEAGWRQLTEMAASRRTLLITHAGVIRFLLWKINSAPFSAFHTYDVPLGSLHRLEAKVWR